MLTVCRGLSKAIEQNMAEVKHGIMTVQTTMKTIHQQIRCDIETRALDWLSEFQSEKKHNDVRSQRLPDTGTWLLEKDEFRRWCDLKVATNVLWCHGIPGAGKTVIS